MQYALKQRNEILQNAWTCGGTEETEKSQNEKECVRIDRWKKKYIFRSYLGSYRIQVGNTNNDDRNDSDDVITIGTTILIMTIVTTNIKAVLIGSLQ